MKITQLLSWRSCVFVCLSLLCAPMPASAATEDAYDFGGMYGYGWLNGGQIGFPNPATNAQSCPPGYDATLVFGAGGVDWSLYLCGRPHQPGRAPLYDFGGMVGLSGSPDLGALPWRSYNYYVNPLTHTDACPDGFQRVQVLGTAGVDNNLFFCFRPHVVGGASMLFGGASGDNNMPDGGYANPVTGSRRTCPAGYDRYTGFGTPGVDYPFYYCALAANRSLQAAGWGSLGIGEPVASNTLAGQQYDLWTQLTHIRSLRPRVFRMWVSSNEFMLSPTTTVQPQVGTYTFAVNDIDAAGITLVGVDNAYPQWMTDFPPENGMWGMPCPSTDPNSKYQAFLSKYAAHWRTLAQLFPQIRRWEVGNETNSDHLWYLAEKCGNTNPGATFTLQQRADITTDLMFRARAAIRSVNPAALVFMPPPSAQDGTSLPLGKLDAIKTFIDMLYANIHSGRFGSSVPSDFFDGVSWHPYIFNDANATEWVWSNNAYVARSIWVWENRKVYSALIENGDTFRVGTGAVPVILSEAGYSTTDPNLPAPMDASRNDVLADWFDHTVHLSQDAGTELPWMTYLIWFRAFDNPSATGPASEQTYGVFKAGATKDVWVRKPVANRFCAFTGCDRAESVKF